MYRAPIALALLTSLLALLLVPGGPARARALNLAVMPVGYVLTPDEVIDTLGRDVVKPGLANEAPGALRLPDMEATTKRRDEPQWLLLSNAPEILNGLSLPRQKGLLVASEVPAGRVRVLVSHSNLSPLSQDFVLRMTNSGDQLADVTIDPRVAAKQNTIPGTYSMDASVGGLLARSYVDAVHAPVPLGWHPPDGDRRRIISRGRSSDVRLVTSVRGLGMSWLTLTTTQPLSLCVYTVPNGGSVEDAPALTRTGSQVRGLFERPDVDVEATVDLAEGKLQRYVFGGAERNNVLGVLDGGNWMTGVDTTIQGQRDPQLNRGDFGGMTYFQATVKAPPDTLYKGALFVLVSGGRRAAVLPLHSPKPVVLDQWGGMILGRARIGETFKYEFTLPPNSWAPVYIVAMPLYQI